MSVPHEDGSAGRKAWKVPALLVRTGQCAVPPRTERRRTETAEPAEERAVPARDLDVPNALATAQPRVRDAGSGR